MRILRTVSLLALASCALSAQAVVVPTDPFLGARRETFTGLVYPNHPVPELTIWNGFGQIVANPGTGEVGVWDALDTTGFGLGPSRPDFHSADGEFGFNGPGYITFTFTSPVRKFGGYFQVSDLTPTLQFTFFDQDGLQIGQDAWRTPDDNVLHWRGYESTTLIGSVRVTGDYIVFDNLQTTPGPAALGPFALGALATLRKRRRKA